MSDRKITVKSENEEFELAGVVVNDGVTREAITKDQMRKFLKFVHDDNVTTSGKELEKNKEEKLISQKMFRAI